MTAPDPPLPTTPTDPKPWIHHERGGDYRDSVGPECPWDCRPTFAPDPQYSQDLSAYENGAK